MCRCAADASTPVASTAVHGRPGVPGFICAHSWCSNDRPDGERFRRPAKRFWLGSFCLFDGLENQPFFRELVSMRLLVGLLLPL